MVLLLQYVLSDLLKSFFTQLPSCICLSEKAHKRQGFQSVLIFVPAKESDLVLIPTKQIENTVNNTYSKHIHNALATH